MIGFEESETAWTGLRSVLIQVMGVIVQERVGTS